MKFILAFLLLVNIVLAEKLQVISSISDIPKNKNIILQFSMDYCPYCVRQEKSLLNTIKPKFPDIIYLKVMNNTPVFQELIETGNFGEVDYFPTTFILIKEENNSIFVKYPFKGWQRSSDIIKILNDKDIMEN